MNKIVEMIISGKITVAELEETPELIERAKFVTKAIAACKKTISFPLGTEKINCYSYMDSAGEYEAWGTCDIKGLFICSSNWGGSHVIGEVNLTNPEKVFLALDDEHFSHDLKRFLIKQIELAEK